VVDPVTDRSAPADPASPRRGRWHAAAQWRARVKSRRSTATAYRIGVGAVGGLIVVAGLALVPLPGPGWLIVFIGLSVLATEFAWAERLLGVARARVTAWTRWAASRPPGVRLLIGVSGVAVLVAAVAGYVAWQGVPAPLDDLV
jgi:uncharacterized protein (TIGR02611 family)